MKRHNEVPATRPLTRLERYTLREIKRSCAALAREHRETVLLWTFDLADPRTTDSASLQTSGVRVLRGWQVPALSPALWCRLVTSDRDDSTGARDFGEVSGQLWRTARAHPMFASTAALPRCVSGSMRSALVALALGLSGIHPLVRSDVIAGTPLPGGGLPFALHEPVDAPEPSLRRMRLGELMNAEPWWSVTRPSAFDLLRHIAVMCMDSGETVRRRAKSTVGREWRTSAWFGKVCHGDLASNTLRMAARQQAGVAEKRGKRWYFDVEWVCGRWSQYSPAIRRKLDEESASGAKGTQEHTRAH